MSTDPRTSVISIVARGDDPWSALDLNRYHDEDCLSQASSSTTASTGSIPADVFSSHEPTIVTKPTSNGTDYPGYSYKYKDEADVIYATSLSASHGSASEIEVEHDDAPHDSFLHMGGWMSSYEAQDQCLRRPKYAKIRLSKNLPYRKKFPIDLHQDGRGFPPVDREIDLLSQSSVKSSLASQEKAPRCLLHRVPLHHYVMLTSICLVVVTVAGFGLAFYHTKRSNDTLRKQIIIASTMFVSFETVLAVLAAGRPLLAASTLGLFPLFTGLMFLVYLDGLTPMH